MATDLAKLVVKLEAQTSQYQRELEKANKKLDGFAKRQVSSLNLVKKGFGVLAAAAAGANFSSFIKSTVDAANHLGDMSVRLGISTEALSELGYAAELSGISTQTLEMGLQRMTRRVAEAANGTGEAVKALHELNVSARDLSALAPDQQFEVLADALMRVEDQGQRVALAMKLFDSEGVKLIQMMSEGSAGLREMRAEAESLGLTVSNETAQGATEFNASIIQLNRGIDALANTLLSKALPYMIEFVNVLNRWAGNDEIHEMEKDLAQLDGRIEYYQGTLERLQNANKDTTETEKKLNAELAERVALVAKLNAAKQGESFNAPAGTPPPVVGGADPLPGQDAAARKKADQAAERIRQQQQMEAERLRQQEEMEAERLRQQEEMEQDAARSKLESVLAGLQTEEEMIRSSWDNRLAILEDAHERGLISEEKYLEQVGRLHAEKEEDLAKLNVGSIDQRLSQASDYYSGLADIAEAGGDRMKDVQRAAAIVSVTISGIQAAMKAYAEAGPFGGAVGAAMMAAQTAVAVAQIAGARAMGGPVDKGKTYLVGERGPELFTAGASGQITANNKLGGDVNVTIVEDAERAGSVQRNENEVQVFVAAAMQALNNDLNSGRGLFASVENRYGLQR